MSESKRTVFLVDDDIDFLEQIKFLLEGENFEVITAHSQKEAEEKIPTIRPDLCIVDLMMENYDSGFILSYHLKKRFPDVPVIMATAVTSETGLRFSSSSEEREWAKADLIMDKGIRHDQLLREIHKLLKD